MRNVAGLAEGVSVGVNPGVSSVTLGDTAAAGVFGVNEVCAHCSAGMMSI